jgi:hypothetical protein
MEEKKEHEEKPESGSDEIADFDEPASKELEPADSRKTKGPEIACIEKGAGVLEILDRFLKEPLAIFNNLLKKRRVGAIFLAALIFSLVFLLVYGFAMGFFGGLHAALFSALKLPIIFLGAFLITLPSFYVFGSLGGAKFSPGQASTMLLANTAASAVILVGLAPVTWFFAISTEGAGFMLALHFTVITIAVIFGFSYLWRGHMFLRRAGGDFSSTGGLLFIWTVLYMFVLCQMFNLMRPLLAEGPFFTGKKQLFFEAIGELVK